MTGDLPAPPSEAGAQYEFFAELMMTERDAMLTAYANSLRGLSSPIVASNWAREQAMRDAAEIIADVAATVRGKETRQENQGTFLDLLIGGPQADSWLSPTDLLRAGSAFCEVTVRSLSRYVRIDPDLLPCFVAAVLALHESIGRRIRVAAHAYAGLVLERVDQAQVEERRRIARDLHDQLGESMSVALRQFELYELTGERGTAAGGESVREAITETMRRLRLVTSDLRQDVVRSLENALVLYLDSVSSEADVRLRVSGSENWVPPAAIGEAFLIIREAIRNALTHGHPRTLLIDITLAPHELHAWVEDDGCGFSIGAASAGIGISSMRERATLLGGRLIMTSTPGQGTQLELLVPLPGARDA